MRRRDFIGLIGAAAWPFVARAQQAMPVLGYLSSGTPELSTIGVNSFRAGLKEGGYEEGRNVTIEYRWADGYDRLKAMADDLVSRKVTAIVAAGGIPAARAAKQATDTIPIVFGVGSDPVAFGLVPSLNRPGGNITGATNLSLELEQKRLELLHEMLPGAARVALLVNPATVLVDPISKDMQAAADAMGLKLQILRASNEKELDDAFAAAAQMHIEALVIGSDAFFGGHGEKLAALAVGLAAISAFPRFTRAGGLMSYGGNTLDVLRLMGIYAGRILSGEKPGDLPVQQSTKVELVINLKTAKALHIDVPVELLGRADDVIE